VEEQVDVNFNRPIVETEDSLFDCIEAFYVLVCIFQMLVVCVRDLVSQLRMLALYQLINDFEVSG
jgi:hypothetical protein